VDFSSSDFTVSELDGSLTVTLVSSGNIPSNSFIIGVIAETTNSTAAASPATGN